MKVKLMFAALITLVLVGCTGTEVKIRPENKNIHSSKLSCGGLTPPPPAYTSMLNLAVTVE